LGYVEQGRRRLGYLPSPMKPFPELKTLSEVRAKFRGQPARRRIASLLDPLGLEPSEVNRLLTRISTRRGEISCDDANDLEPLLDGLPPRQPPRVGAAPEPPDPVVPRSRLIDQFYSHQLAGVERGVFSDIRRLIAAQHALQRQAKNGAELLNYAMRNLFDALLDAPVAGGSGGHHAGDESTRGNGGKGPQCPPRFMGSSIAIVLEHTEHITMNIQRWDEDATRLE
jgi:hypothetical protein